MHGRLFHSSVQPLCYLHHQSSSRWLIDLSHCTLPPPAVGVDLHKSPQGQHQRGWDPDSLGDAHGRG